MLRSLVLWLVLTIALIFAMALIAGGAFGIGLFELGLAAAIAAGIVWWDARRRRRAKA